MRAPLFLLACAATLPAQSFVQGHVFDSITGLPVGGVSFETWQTMGDPSPLSNPDGSFHVPINKDAGRILLQRAGYLRRDQPLPSGAKTLPTDLQIPLTPEAVITGKIEDQDGAPVWGADLEMLYYTYAADGQRRLVNWHWNSTNERGEYRISNLPARRYFIRIKPSKLAEWDPRYTPRYYPSTIDFSRAEDIEVKAGEQRNLPTVRLTRLEGVSVSGRIALPPGAARYLRLESADSLGYVDSAKWRGDDFTFSHVPPGSYVLTTARPGLPQRIGTARAHLNIEVGGADMNGIAVTVAPLAGVDLAGTVAWPDGRAIGKVRIQLSTDNPVSFRAETTAGADGAFVVKGLLPGRYRLAVYPESGQAVSALLGDREVLSSDFDIGLSPPGILHVKLAPFVGHLSGTLTDASGAPLWGALVRLVPANRGAQAATMTDANGLFELNVLSVGEYRVYVEANHGLVSEMPDPGYFKAHASDYPAAYVYPGESPPLSLKWKGGRLP